VVAADSFVVVAAGRIGPGSANHRVELGGGLVHLGAVKESARPCEGKPRRALAELLNADY
jgi:hypothetical protein